MRTSQAFTIGCVLVPLLVGGCGKGTRQAAKDAAKDAATFAKEAAAGIDEGLDEGRKSSPGMDGATVVSTAQELSRSAEVKVHAVYGDSEGVAAVELAITNKLAVPLRIIHLGRPGALVFVDTDGFSTPPTDVGFPAEFTILPNAKQKETVHFRASPAKAKMVILHGLVCPVPPEAIRASASQPATLPAGGPAMQPEKP